MAFWTFVEIIKRYDVIKVFQEETPSCLENFRYCLEVIAPELAEYLRMVDLNIKIFVSGWLRTLFCQQFELELVFRLWDVFFVEGIDFLIKIALSMLFYSKGTTRCCTCGIDALTRFYRKYTQDRTCQRRDCFEQASATDMGC